MKAKQTRRCGLGGSDSRGRVNIFIQLSLVALLLDVLFVESVEGKVRCYVCSWHSPSLGRTNMTDTCSHYNFDEAYAQTIECDEGCEAVSIRKSKNENVVNFYKNCKSPSRTVSDSKDGCTTIEDESFRYVTTCECSSNLCNNAERGRIPAWGCFLIASVVVSAILQ